MNKKWQLLNIFFTIIVIVVNTLANALPLNGQTTGEVSDRFDVLFVPAGYVFSIWGLIYLGLIAFTVFQALPKQKANSSLKKISPYYWLTCIANSTWIFFWHFELFQLTIIAMVILLFGLIMIYRVWNITEQKSSPIESVLVGIPFSIYLGWVSVATIANFAQVLVYANWNGWGISAQIWTVIMLAVTGILGFIMLWREKDHYFGLVLIWALIGISLKQKDIAFISTSAWFVIGILTILLIYRLLGRNVIDK